MKAINNSVASALIVITTVSFLNGCKPSCDRASFFEPYAHTEIRLPSVPVFVSDPYVSFWSPYDKLTDGPVCHWTDVNKPIIGLVRVDGQTYRFFGDEMFKSYVPIAPMANTVRWTAPASNVPQKNLKWTMPDFDDKSWPVQTAAWGSNGN